MRMRLSIATKGVLLALFMAGSPCLVPARAAQQYVPLGPARAVYYTPESAPATTAFLIVHRTSDFTAHIGCGELSKRGFAALCMNTRFVNNELLVDWDRIALDVKAGVEFLRAQPGIRTVILFGHSGGGPTLSFYQAVAEAKLSFCKDPMTIWRVCRKPMAWCSRTLTPVCRSSFSGA